MAREVITFGCRLNTYESEVIKRNLDESGEDNIVVFNTCAVTKEAERQAKQAIRRYIRENPETKVIVTGCGAQIDPKKYSSIEGVSKVIGNEEKMKAETYKSPSFLDISTEKVLVNDIMSVTETASHLITSLEDRARAFMQVQNGCDHRCTFCIIPYGRGNSRSVPVAEVIRQAQILVEKGYNEIVLTGVDISSYGADLPGNPKLGEMMRRLLKLVPDLKRLRLSSIDVAEVDEDILWLVANEPRFMPYFHLSLQAGDDMVLKRMKRRHTREQTIEFYNKVKALRSDVVFGADIIAGFPTEDDEMFENTRKIISETQIIFGHIFPYSEREGTPAAKIPADKQVPKNIRKERAKILREEANHQLQKFLQSRIGKTESVVVENGNLGRTEHFAMVRLHGENKVGDLINVNIAAVEGEYLVEAAG